jgi:hypothetical protein
MNYHDLNKQDREKVRKLLDGKDISDRDLKGMYCSILDAIYGKVVICGSTYPTSHALASVDKVAFNCGFADWIGTNDDIVEIDGKYYNTGGVDDAIQEVIKDEDDE